MSSILADQQRPRIVYEREWRGRGGGPGSQPMSTAVHRNLNKLWNLATYLTYGATLLGRRD